VSGEITGKLITFWVHLQTSICGQQWIRNSVPFLYAVIITTWILNNCVNLNARLTMWLHKVITFYVSPPPARHLMPPAWDSHVYTWLHCLIPSRWTYFMSDGFCSFQCFRRNRWSHFTQTKENYEKRQPMLQSRNSLLNADRRESLK
jgi:hypothetical protein